MSTEPFRRLIRPSARVALGAIVSIAALLRPGSVAAGGSVDDPVRAGDATIVDAYNQSKPLDHGTGKTTFSLRLPDGAACPGDSRNDQWRVQTYLLPFEEDPVSVRYGPIGPDPVGNGRYAMFDVNTTPYVQQLTRQNLAAGQPGVIAPLPPFSFAVVAGEQIPSGRYRLGVACTYFGATAVFWDTEIELVDPPGGAAGKLTWHLPGVTLSAASEGDGVSPWIVFGALGAIPILAVIGLIVWRRDGRQPTLTKEAS